VAETARAEALRRCAAPAHVGRGDAVGRADMSRGLTLVPTLESHSAPLVRAAK